MSNLDRIIELASHGTSRAQGQVPAKTQLNEAPGVKYKGQTGSDREYDRGQKMHDMGSNNPNKDRKDDNDFKDQVAADDAQQAAGRAKKKLYNKSGSNPAGEFSEAVGEFSEPLYTLQDELGLEDNILVDELARWMDAQQITEFVKRFRQNHEMDADQTEESVTNEATGVCEDCGCEIDNCKPGCDCPNDSHDASGDHWVAEAKAKPDFADIDGDGDKDEDMKKAAKDKEDLDEAQSPAQKAAFAKMLASKGGKKADESDETDTDDKEELDESPTMDTTQLITLLKNSGLSEEAIETKLTEWANTPDGAAEEEATSHGEPYENFAQSVNLSLKRYLDAEDMKVGLKEHTIADIKEAYKKSKGE